MNNKLVRPRAAVENYHFFRVLQALSSALAAVGYAIT